MEFESIHNFDSVLLNCPRYQVDLRGHYGPNHKEIALSFAYRKHNCIYVSHGTFCH